MTFGRRVLRHRLRHAGDPDRDRHVRGTGDEVVIPTPAWPNAAAAAGINRRQTDDGADAFRQGVDARPRSARGCRSDRRPARYVVVTPSNPTGWTATRDELVALLGLARRHGLWIVADEIYARFWYGEGPRAPSFFDVMEPEDLILFVNTFSKNWAMTGWRIGWIAAHPALGQVIENMIQYSTSGVAQFMQRAGVAALERGEASRHQIARARRGRASPARRWRRRGVAALRFPRARSTCFSRRGRNRYAALALRLIDSAGSACARHCIRTGGEEFCACASRAKQD